MNGLNSYDITFAVSDNGFRFYSRLLRLMRKQESLGLTLDLAYHLPGDMFCRCNCLFDSYLIFFETQAIKR